MRTQYERQLSRRRFLGGLTLAGTAGLLGWHPRQAAAEPPPETTRLRLHKIAGICIAPQYIAEELLYLEGFTEVQYVEMELARGTTAFYQSLASGALDIAITFTPLTIIRVDAGAPIVLL